MLGEFVFVSQLWTGENPMYPSQQSALWALRQMRRALAQGGALALHRGRTMIHPKKMAQIAEEIAIEKARKRYGGA
jgi:hypothetical protein